MLICVYTAVISQWFSLSSIDVEKKKKKKNKRWENILWFQMDSIIWIQIEFPNTFSPFRAEKKKAAADAEKTFFPSSSTVIDIYMWPTEALA